jgi:hypothetical protein
MKIIRHVCPGIVEENLQILTGPGNGILHINRIKGEDYYIEFFNADGRIIISCNFPSYMKSKAFDLNKYDGNEYTIRVSNQGEEGECLYRVFKY